MTAIGEQHSTPHLEPNWSSSGYDLNRGDRWLYAFLTRDGARVKVGLVLTEARLARRLREVAKACNEPELKMVATSVLPNVTHQEAEHLESIARHWIARQPGFDHAGSVDWLVAPGDDNIEWQELLDSSVDAAMAVG